ncbi:hypothetical protein ACMAZE_04350 [Pseudopelagicola sp. nBUS_20]|uniref:hypothetical protein n=1 Tax=Pseudopelagicola sp. nBUS_20 TaxID=3395317 RepID=UPI003EBAD498
MNLRALFFTVLFLPAMTFSSSVLAESWRAVSQGNNHAAIYKDVVFVENIPGTDHWYLAFGIEPNSNVSSPKVTLTAPDGKLMFFEVNTEFTEVSPRPEAGISILRFPINHSTLEQLQSHSSITLKLGEVAYRSPLKGSRAAISTALERVVHDAAVADDEQHTIAQAESDAAQLKARQARAVPLGGIRPWTYRGQKNAGTLAESFESSASVDDETMSLVYFPIDDAFFLWFTYNGDQSFSQKHAERAEIFIRTSDVSGGGRNESDYVFKGHTVAQPDSNPRQPQFVVTRLSPEDIRALRLNDGKEIGAGYFIGENWKTFRLPGKDLWKSFVELAVAVNRTDLLE